ncbi:MAG TPA: hypothetical protein VLT86_11520 [Vicinamibacterales bacterium]|nr:hypothetical protein [Vicinamibacterales bacterium]
MSSAFDDACALVERVLQGDARRQIVADAASSGDAGRAIAQLREWMRADAWILGSARVDLAGAVAALDRHARADGFHAIHDWDGKAERVNQDTIAIEVASYILGERGTGPADPLGLAILLDYYILYVLALLSLNVWAGDDGAADARLDRLDHLLGDLQGPDGSGQPFAADAATLMLLGTSHYESDDGAYDRMLARARTLGPRQRLRLAHIHAVCLGGHLRFGIEATYGQDYGLMRDDNGVDYRWLGFALSTLMGEYVAAGSAGTDREPLVEALIGGLTADAAAFLGSRPLPSLATMSSEVAEFRDRVRDRRDEVVEAFERHRPRDDIYSPIALFFNFSQNVLKGEVVDAILWGEPWPLTLNDLLSGLDSPARSSARVKLATTLMDYARRSPDRIRGRPMPAIVYDFRAGRRAFSAAMRAVRDL